MFASGGCTWVRPQAPSTVWLHPRSLSHVFPSKEKQEAWKSTQLLCLCVLQVFWACVPVGVWQGSQGPEALQLSESSWMEPQSGNQIWALTEGRGSEPSDLLCLHSSHLGNFSQRILHYCSTCLLIAAEAARDTSKERIPWLQPDTCQKCADTFLCSQKRSLVRRSCCVT